MQAKDKSLFTSLPAHVRLSAYERGYLDSANNVYHPPLPCERDAYDAYVRGWNDAWAAANNVTLLR